jgi:acyl carrier protein
MDRNLILKKIKKIVKPYVPSEKLLNNVNDETDFLRDLEINSINLVDIIIDVESEFNIEIDNESMEKMTSVGAAIDIITDKVNSQ